MQNIIKEFDKLYSLLTVPTYKYTKFDKYVFGQTTYDFFEPFINYVYKNQEATGKNEVMNKKVSIDIGDAKLMSLFTNINNPVLLCESYSFYPNDSMDDDESDTNGLNYKFSWNYNDKKVYLCMSMEDCPYHITEYPKIILR